MRRLIVGDVHGCHDELLELIDRAALGGGDEVVAVGDLVGRGPRTPAVLSLFGAVAGSVPGARSGAAPALSLRTVMGNHELRHVRVWSGAMAETFSVRRLRHELGEGVWRRACLWMRDLPASIELPEALVIHALWEPGVPRARQRPEVLIGAHEAEEELNRRLGDRPWYEAYDGEPVLICGHHDYGRTQQPLVVRDRVFCIDTGCVYGGRLTGLLLPEFRFVSVPSRGGWWSAEPPAE